MLMTRESLRWHYTSIILHLCPFTPQDFIPIHNCIYVILIPTYLEYWEIRWSNPDFPVLLHPMLFLLCFQISIGTFYYPSKVDISADYKGRATMTNDVQSTSGVSTLSFSHVTMQENRVFQCKVQIPGDNDGEPSDTTQLVVLGKMWWHAQT